MVVEIQIMICWKSRLIFYLFSEFRKLRTTGIDAMRQYDRRSSRNIQRNPFYVRNPAPVVDIHLNIYRIMSSTTKKLRQVQIFRIDYELILIIFLIVTPHGTKILFPIQINLIDLRITWIL